MKNRAFDLSQADLDTITYAVAQMMPKLVVRDYLLCFLNVKFWLNRRGYYRDVANEALVAALEGIVVAKRYLERHNDDN